MNLKTLARRLAAAYPKCCTSVQVEHIHYSEAAEVTNVVKYSAYCADKFDGTSEYFISAFSFNEFVTVLTPFLTHACVENKPNK
jgi:hypothetical protein